MKKGTKFNAYVVQPRKLAIGYPFVFKKENPQFIWATDSVGEKRQFNKTAFTFEELKR